ncbi:hypothetical protein [Spirosoma lituiforme]
MKLLSLGLMGVLFVSTSVLSGCREQKTLTTNKCPEASEFVRQANDLEGTVYYDSDQDRYGIQVATSMDSADMGLTCNLPKSYQKAQCKVRFSGQYYAYAKPVNAPAGYKHYYLTLDSIQQR